MWGPTRFRQYMILRKVAYQPGARVRWADQGRPNDGIVLKVFTHYLERTMNGSTVRQPANKRDPAYLIEQECGATLLINHSELLPAY